MTTRQKFEKPTASQPKRLETAFAGVPAGSLLYISTPRELDERIRRIPAGQTVGIAELRADLAETQGADATCPVTTAMYLRIVAELALEQLAAGTPVDEVAPFWRVIDPESPIAARVEGAADLIRSRRTAEENDRRGDL